ncbi:unnamed protein product [Sphagnum balticum]
MAKDPNNSDNGNTPNQIGDFGLSRLAEIASESRPSAEERELRRKAKVARKGIDLYDSLEEVTRQYEPIQKLQKRNINTLSRTEPRIRIAVEARQQRLTAQAVNTISREFSEQSINSSVNEMSLSPEAQQGSLRMMNTPYNDLVGQQRERMARLQSLGEANKAMASKVIGRQGINQEVYGNMQANTKEAQGLMNELGTIGAALQQQKTLGLDPKSRTTGLMQDVMKAQATSQQDPAYAAAQNLVKSFEKLKEVTDITSKEFTDLQKTTEEAREAFAASGGGGGRSGRDTFMSYANIAQSGFGAAAGAIQAIGVNQRLTQAQNAAGYADFENEKYKTYKAAAGGDIASLMQLSQFSGAEDFGGSLKTAANVAVGAQVAGGLTQVGMGVVDVASTLNPGENAISTSAAQANRERGIINTIEGAATVAVGTSDLARDASGGQADLAGRQGRLSVSRAINAVSAEQVQGFRDYAVGMSTAAIGMGSRGEEFLNSSVSDSYLSRMASARISPEQMAQMSQMGVTQMGSMFNENQVFEARTNEQRGLGTMQENMQRMSALAAAGSNNPTEALGAITENAIAKGLDSSKALNAVVDHTAAMASSTTGRAIGIDTSAAATSLLTAGITKDTPNKEAALERAASLQETFNQVGTNAGTSYAGMVNIARINKDTGLDGVSSVLASQISDADLMSMNDQNATKMLNTAGVDVRGKNAPDIVKKLKEDRQMTLLETGNFGINYDRADTLKRIKSGQALTYDEELGVSRAAAFLKMKTGANVTGDDIKSRIAAFDKALPKEAYGPTNVDDGSKRASLDKLRTAGFEQLSTAASTAATNLGGASIAIKTLTTAIESLSEKMPNVEKNATTAAGKAAAGDKGMNMDITKFNGAIDKLDKVLSIALARSNLGSSSGTTTQKAKAPG